MKGPTEVLGAVLKADLTDNGTAAAYLAAYPTLFTAVGDVPVWCYSSLKTIYDPTAANNADFQKRIITQQGISANVGSGDIVIQLTPYESVRVSRSRHDDGAGAEVAKVQILVRQPTPTRSNASALPSDPDRVSNATERIKWLLDFTSRQKRWTPTNFLVPDLPIPIGTGILPLSDDEGYFQCYFEGLEVGENANQNTITFRCEYKRIVLP